MTAVLPARVAERRFAAPSPDAGPGLGSLERAILEALAYSDVFDWPLTAAEIHRNLPVAATLAEIEAALAPGAAAHPHVERHGELFALRGRAGNFAVRARREAASRVLWPRAVAWARVLAALPFVRLVAVTGSLAVGSAEPGDDVDYLVVTAPGRVWLTRAAAMLVVRAARLRGLRLCPNYFLAESALELPERSLFAAHELVQAVPVVAGPASDALLAANGWYRDWLPNARPRRPVAREPRRPVRALGGVAERALRARLFDPIERWEMRRKSRSLRAGSPSPEMRFGPEICKGHADGHGRRVQAAYDGRLRRLNEVM